MNQSTVAVHSSSRDLLIVNIELCKWVGLVLMVWDHVDLYLGWGSHSLANGLGAFAFPLFAVSLSASCFDLSADKRSDVLQRMLVWAFVAQCFALLVRDGVMLNVIFTLAIGLFVFHELVEPGAKRWQLIALLMGLSVFVEFAVAGPLLVVFLCFLFKVGSEGKLRRDLLGACAVCLVFLYPFNEGALVAILAPLVVFVLGFFPEVPRVRGIFYYLYAGQFVAYWSLLHITIR